MIGRQLLGVGCGVGSLLLGGCMVGPDYKRPEVKMPEAHRFAEASAATAPAAGADLAALGWTEIFNDPVVDGLVREALTNNYDLRLALQNITTAEAQLRQVNAPLWPWLSANGSASRNRVSENYTSLPHGTSRTSNSFALGGSLGFSPDFWGGTRRLVEAAEAGTVQSEWSRVAVHEATVSGVLSAYVQLRALDQELVLARKTLASRQESLELMKQRNAAGTASGLEVSQNESLVHDAEAKIVSLEQAVGTVENSLCVLLGRMPGPVERGLEIGSLKAKSEVPAGLPSSLLERRPDLGMAEEQLRAASARIGASKAKFFPTFTLTGTAGWQSHDLDTLLRQRSSLLGITPAVSLPIFQGGLLSAQLEEAKSQYEAARLSYEKTALTACEDVSTALLNLKKSREYLDRQAQYTDSVRNMARLSRERYLAGNTDYLNVLDAERQLFSAELQQLDAGSAALRAHIALYLALGGGFSEKSGDGAIAAPRSRPAAASPRAEAKSGR